MEDEHLGKCWFVTEHTDDGLLLKSHNLAFRHRSRRRHAAQLAGQTTFAEESIRPKDRDDGLVPLLRNDSDLDLAVTDVKDGIRRIAL
jgi:hypothetical protein